MRQLAFLLLFGLLDLIKTQIGHWFLSCQSCLVCCNSPPYAGFQGHEYWINLIRILRNRWCLLMAVGLQAYNTRVGLVLDTCLQNWLRSLMLAALLILDDYGHGVQYLVQGFVAL